MTFTSFFFNETGAKCLKNFVSKEGVKNVVFRSVIVYLEEGDYPYEEREREWEIQPT